MTVKNEVFGNIYTIYYAPHSLPRIWILLILESCLFFFLFFASQNFKNEFVPPPPITLSKTKLLACLFNPHTMFCNKAMLYVVLVQKHLLVLKEQNVGKNKERVAVTDWFTKSHCFPGEPSAPWPSQWQ